MIAKMNKSLGQKATEKFVDISKPPEITNEIVQQKRLDKYKDLAENLTTELKEFVKEGLAFKENELSSEKRSITNPDQNIVQVKGIPIDWTEQMIMNYFDSDRTLIKKLQPILNKLGKPTDRSLVHFSDRQTANKFIQRYNNDYIHTDNETSPIQARLYDLQTSIKAFKAEQIEKTVMIYNLPYEVTNKQVTDFAKEHGEVKNLYFPMRSSTKNRGYGVVEYFDKESVTSIMARSDGITMFGREIKLKTKEYSFARPKKVNESGSTKSDLIIARAEKTEIKIKNFLNDLAKEEIRKTQAELPRDNKSISDKV